MLVQRERLSVCLLYTLLQNILPFIYSMWHVVSSQVFILVYIAWYRAALTARTRPSSYPFVEPRVNPTENKRHELIDIRFEYIVICSLLSWVHSGVVYSFCSNEIVQKRSGGRPYRFSLQTLSKQTSWLVCETPVKGCATLSYDMSEKKMYIWS